MLGADIDALAQQEDAKANNYAAEMFGENAFGPPGGDAAEAHALGRRLAVTQSCQDSMTSMLNDKNWLFANNSMTRWCRVRLENKMAACCGIALFATGRAESCSAENCIADCIHSLYDNVCNKHFGQACVVTRPPFRDGGTPVLQVKESFCVPDDCNNPNDIQVVMPYFATTFRDRRAGWHLDYDQALVECPSIIGAIIGFVVAGVFLCVAGSYVSWYVFKAPYTKGKVMIDQEEFAGMTPVEDFDGTGQDLRQTGQSMQSQPLQPLLG